jgi:hypothetical protein
MVDIIPKPKITIAFSASSFDLFCMCPAKYNYAHNMRKTLPMKHRSKNLDFGSLGHVGLEVYYNGLRDGHHFSDRMQATLMKIREVASNPDESNIDIEEDLSTITNAIEQSCDYWRSEDEQLEVLAVEAPFDYILYEDDEFRIIISGKIDLLVNIHGIGNNASYSNLPIDHKTYSRDFPVLRLSNQFMNYAVASGSNYLLVNRIGLQKTLKAEEKFKRVPLSYDPIILSEWKNNVIGKIMNDYLSAVGTGKWTMDFTSCYKFNRLCEFQQLVCDASGEETKLFNLETHFIENKKYDKYERSET